MVTLNFIISTKKMFLISLEIHFCGNNINIFLELEMNINSIFSSINSTYQIHVHFDFVAESFTPSDIELLRDGTICEKYLNRAGASVEDAVNFTLRSFSWRKQHRVSGISSSYYESYSLLSYLSLPIYSYKLTILESVIKQNS